MGYQIRSIMCVEKVEIFLTTFKRILKQPVKNFLKIGRKFCKNEEKIFRDLDNDYFKEIKVQILEKYRF